jgi:hypothetical protein
VVTFDQRNIQMILQTFFTASCGKTKQADVMKRTNLKVIHKSYNDTYMDFLAGQYYVIHVCTENKLTEATKIPSRNLNYNSSS